MRRRSLRARIQRGSIFDTRCWSRETLDVTVKNPSPSQPPKAKVPVTRFFFFLILQLVVAGALYKLIAPVMWADEFSRPWMIVLGVFLFGLPLSLFEYLYHRYLLHSAVLPFLGSMHEAHATHHSLTYVKAPVRANEPGKMVPVDSEFPILVEEQEESMMFPLYSLAIFYAIFLVALGMPLKLLFPAAPVFSSLIIAITWHYVAYEMWHAVLHLPFERFWRPLMTRKYTRTVTRRVYSFHLMHHWRPTSNLAVVGFWGVAMWDHMFRTHRRPENLPLQGAEVNYFDAKLKKPLYPIAIMDRWQGAWNRRSRKLEAALIRLFSRRQQSETG